MNHSYLPGDTVTILNQNMQGEAIIEGDAELVEEVSGTFEDLPCFMVLFDGDDEPVKRNIYPQEAIDEVRAAQVMH